MSKKWAKNILIGLLSIATGACQYHEPPPPQPENTTTVNTVAAGVVGGAVTGAMLGLPIPVFTAMGAISGAAIGAQLNKETQLDKLRRSYVQIISVGEDMMLVLPSTYYFYPDSTHLNESFYASLDEIADYIGEFQPPVIKVSGYTDNTGDATRNVALSRQQAQAIAHYLWTHTLDGRMIYAMGYGSEYPIATNETPAGRATNRRIQITFRRVDRKIGEAHGSTA